MTTTVGPLRERPARPWVVPALVALVVALAAALVVSLASHDDGTVSGTRGSGRGVTEQREVAAFTSIDLAGGNTMAVRVGEPQAVRVSADDNLVDLITTTVRDGTLVVDDQGSFTTRSPMIVRVAVPSLDALTLSGDGTITIEQVAGPSFTVTLSGSGTVEASGTVDRLTAALTADGMLDLGGLRAHDAVVRLEGTGTVLVHADATLDATLTGTGTIVYAGDPHVTTHQQGSGVIVPE